MSDAIVIGAVIYVLSAAIGKIVYHTGDNLLDFGLPFSYPEIVDFIVYMVGSILKGAGFVANKLAVVFACVYILKELL